MSLLWELLWLPWDGLRDRESKPDMDSDLPTPACGYSDPQLGVGQSPCSPCHPTSHGRELGLQVGPKPAWAGSVPQLPRHAMEPCITAPGRDQWPPRCDRPLCLPHSSRAETGEPVSCKCSAPPRQSCSWKEICHMSLFTSEINLPLRQVNLRQNL